MIEGRERISVTIRPAGSLPGQSFDFVCLVTETEKRNLLRRLRALRVAPQAARPKPIIAKIEPCPKCRALGYRAGVALELCGTCGGDGRHVSKDGGKGDAVSE